MRAANAISKIPYSKLFEQFTATKQFILPDPKNAAIYDDALKKYAELEKTAKEY